MKERSLLFFRLLALCTAVATVALGLSKETDQDEDYAVYKALLSDASAVEHLMCHGSQLQLFVIEKSTTLHGIDEPIDAGDNPRLLIENYLKKQWSEAVDPRTLANFFAANEQSRNLTPELDLPVKYLLVSEQDLKPFFGKGGSWWKGLFERYPQANGLVEFSRVGFNPNRDQALVYAGSGCGGKNGSGFLYLLEKKSGSWTVLRQAMVWIS